jgi:uncharacterized protein with GYD domain
MTAPHWAVAPSPDDDHDSTDRRVSALCNRAADNAAGVSYNLHPGFAGKDTAMATYIMLSTLTDEGRKTLKERPERLQEVNREIEAMGARVTQQYAVLGGYDFINILEAPDNETVARISVELGSRGTVQLTSLAAIPVDEFTRMLKGNA